MFDILLHCIFICNRLVICWPMSAYKNKIGDTYASSMYPLFFWTDFTFVYYTRPGLEDQLTFGLLGPTHLCTRSTNES